MDMEFYGMDAIGQKSKGAYRSSFIGGTIGIAFAAFFLAMVFRIIPEFDDSSYFMYIFMMVPAIIVIACVAGIIKGILIMRMPSDLVFANDDMIKLVRPGATIMISDIEAVIGDNTSHTHTNNNGASYTTVERYGSIVIRTKSGQRYVQKYLDHVQEVAQILNNRIIKKNL